MNALHPEREEVLPIQITWNMKSSLLRLISSSKLDCLNRCTVC